MKRLASLVIICAIAAMACADGGAARRIKIGFLAPTLQNEIFISMDDGLKKSCAQRGWGYVSVSFDNDSVKAVSAIENMATGKCSAIIAMVSDSSCDAALRTAQEGGAKIMEVGVETSVHDVYLGPDQYGIGAQIGEMASDYINERLDGEGKVVVYTTFQNQDMQSRGQGILDTIAKSSPKARILEVVDIGKDVVGSGSSTTENMLRKHPDMNVIACYGDAAAVESMEAVKAAGRAGDAFGIFSCDGTDRALKAIATNGVLRGTVMSAATSASMLEYCERSIKGEKFPEKIASVMTKITRDNVAAFYKEQQ
jgi:ABC-type sugar transport system, periplasmic component